MEFVVPLWVAGSHAPITEPTYDCHDCQYALKPIIPVVFPNPMPFSHHSNQRHQRSRAIARHINRARFFECGARTSLQVRHS